jgi:small basic protein (TIGR04137 family)
MTIDKSLRVKRGATRNRSVLTRMERIARLREADRWKEGDSPLGLPKVRVRKLTMKKKKKKKEEEGAEGADGAAAATAATPAPAAGGKAPAGKAPAAGGKGAGK